jgi:hypothetical protein
MFIPTTFRRHSPSEDTATKNLQSLQSFKVGLIKRADNLTGSPDRQALFELTGLVGE